MSRRIIVEELEFDVPYGKLAGKSWHEDTDDCKRILALHGWMDNAGSFDNIVPHLEHQKDLYIVALDLPGHGRSSQLPPGTAYSDIDIIMEIRRCLTQLEWIQPVGVDSDSKGGDSSRKKFSILGHSMGAGLGLFYSSLFPDDVDEIVLLDFIKSRTTSAEQMLINTAAVIDSFISVSTSRSPFSSPRLSSGNQNRNSDKGQVTVSQEAAIIATIEAHKALGVLTREDATCLLKRSTVAVSSPPNSVIYSRDLRLQSMLNIREHIELNKIMFASVQCNILTILGKNGIYCTDELFMDNMDFMKDYIKARAKSFTLQWLDADHYLHMNRPKETAEIINKYFRRP